MSGHGHGGHGGHEGPSIIEQVASIAVLALVAFFACWVIGSAWSKANDPFEQVAEKAAHVVGWDSFHIDNSGKKTEDCIVGDKTYETIKADSADCASLHDLATKAAGTSGGGSAPTDTPIPTDEPAATQTPVPPVETPASQDDLVAQHAKDPWSFGNHCWIDERVLPLGVGSNRIYVPDDTNALLKSQGGTCYVQFGSEMPFTFNSSQGQVYVDEKLVRSDNGVVTKGTKFRVVYGAENGANGFDITN